MVGHMDGIGTLSSPAAVTAALALRRRLTNQFTWILVILLRVPVLIFHDVGTLLPSGRHLLWVFHGRLLTQARSQDIPKTALRNGKQTSLAMIVNV